MSTITRVRHVFVAMTSLVAVLCSHSSVADETRVVFDLPDTIECRDVTPEKFAAAHPTLKVIEAKFRVSARITEGTESEIVDFLYIAASPSKRMKIQDYLPNTTLESTVANDQIEVVESSETTSSSSGEARVSYHSLALGGTKNQTSRTSGTSQYKRIAPKALILASGTTNREHGVFFKLRPSKGTSLEGAKEFTFLATVPKAWRGDWCTVSCAARAQRSSFLSETVEPAGVEQSHIGMYLAGDREASDLAVELRKVQEATAPLLEVQVEQNEAQVQATMYAAIAREFILGRGWDESMSMRLVYDIYKAVAPDTPGDPAEQKRTEAERKKLEQARKVVATVHDRLARLSGTAP